MRRAGHGGAAGEEGAARVGFRASAAASRSGTRPALPWWKVLGSW